MSRTSEQFTEAQRREASRSRQKFSDKDVARMRQMYDDGCFMLEIAERMDTHRDRVAECLYRSGVTFHDLKMHEHPVQMFVCGHCQKEFRQRVFKSAPPRYCSPGCRILFNQARGAEAPKPKKFGGWWRDVHDAAEEHRAFLRRVGVQKAIRAHNDKEADEAIVRPPKP